MLCAVLSQTTRSHNNVNSALVTVISAILRADMRKPVLALIAAVVLGIFAFAWWRHAGSVSSSQSPSAATKPGAQRQPSEPRPEREAPAAPVLVDDDPRGTLRLEGQVLDADEHPVAGAIVVLGSNPSRTTTTEQDGGFAFDALIGRPYTLVARATQGIAGPITAKLTEKSDPVVLHLRPAAHVTVTVAGVDGKPIDGATVELRGIDTQRTTTKAGIATFATVVPGGYQVAAWADKMAHAMTWIQVSAGDTTTKLTLSAGAAVSGRVVDDHGNPVEGARVTYHGASDWSQQADERYDAITTTKDGSFRFAAMPGGSFRFVAAHDQFAPGTSSLVTLDGTSEHTGLVITVSAGATVRGRVVDATKQPLPSARVRIGISSRRGMIFEPPRQAYTDAKGVFEIKGLPKRELAAVAMHESGASQTATVDATLGDVGDVTLVVDVTGSISGIVVDPQGQPVDAVQVSAGPNFRDQRATSDFTQWRLRGFPQDLTDPSGHFTLTGLAQGSYSITAVRAHAASRGRAGATEGVVAETGTKDLKIVLAPEGGVKGKVAFADGSTPAAFTVSVGMTQQSFLGDGTFELDALPPQKYELSVRGPSFQTRVVEVVVESGKTADAGTITVAKGRILAGTVVADGQPVAGATVYAGRMLFGNGTSNSANFGPMGQGTKQATTEADGSFSLAGFNDGDLAITAEHPAIGRSKAMRIPTDLSNQGELVLELQKFGALSGVLRQAGKPAEGILVSCQSSTTPGAIYGVASGADGAYRYDRLAPDTYKVSATVGMPMMGMKFYSKEIVVPPGKEVTIDLAVEPGTVTLQVQPVPKAGKLGVASVWVASGNVSARTATELSVRMAASGQGASQWVIIRAGEPARIAELTPGNYSACVVPFPAEVQGMGAMGY
ncbi:MAG: hypothetical protein JWO36_728, partial [Myxococcales bacterium]|nr:hypothetical protein [Myxococcales bacterium]